MALSTKDTYNLLKEFNEYGATVYYLIEEGKLTLEDVMNILFKTSLDQVTLVFPRFIEKISVEEIDEAKKKYSVLFTKLDCIDRIIQKDNDRHQHLKEIRDIVSLEEKADEMVKNSTYLNALNLQYTSKILDEIEEEVATGYFRVRDAVKLYRTALDLLKNECDKKISSNIDSYYISSITN